MHPEQRLLVVGVVAVAPRVRADVLLDAAADLHVHVVHAARGGERVIEVAEDHRKDVPEGAREAPDRIGARLTVLIDGVRHEGVRELKERRRAAAEHDHALAVHLPREGARTVEAGARIARARDQLREVQLEILPRDRHGDLPSFGVPAARARGQSPRARYSLGSIGSPRRSRDHRARTSGLASA